MHTPPPNAPENEPHSRPAVCPPQIFVITSLPVVQEALLLRAIESFEDVRDGKRVKRVPGDKWIFYGPGDYIPPVQVEVLAQGRVDAMAHDGRERVMFHKSWLVGRDAATCNTSFSSKAMDDNG